MVIHTHLVKIGNTQSIPIPQVVLEQLPLEGELTLEVVRNQLIIRPLTSPRQHWAAQFQRMAELEDDELLDGDLASTSLWDEEEWEW